MLYCKKVMSNKENIWSSILSDVRTRENTKLPSCKSVLVLGDNQSGKTTLVAKLKGIKNTKKGLGLEYTYIDVQDDYRDDHTRLNVWVLDGDPVHTNLLKFALNDETFPHTIVVLVVAMTSPWAILDQLQHWASVLADHLDKLKINADLQQTRKQHLVKTWQEYTEPDEFNVSSPLKRRSKSFSESVENIERLENGFEPLPKSVLKNNLGLDIIVVVTKTDYMATLEKQQGYRDEHFDFMQQWIRRFCLQYGAALFYTSIKEDKNCDLLYKYLTHRIYGFLFRTRALVLEKDAVFIPSGWDSKKKISILNENMHSCKSNDYYKDIIVQPVIRKVVSSTETEIIAEDEQTFLARQQQILLSGGDLTQAESNSGESPKRAGSGSVRNATPRARTSPSMQGSPKKLDSTKVVGVPDGEGVLANFFSSLLHKKSGAVLGSTLSPQNSGGISGTSDLTMVQSDAVAERNRSQSID